MKYLIMDTFFEFGQQKDDAEKVKLKNEIKQLRDEIKRLKNEIKQLEDKLKDADTIKQQNTDLISDAIEELYI